MSLFMNSSKITTVRLFNQMFQFGVNILSFINKDNVLIEIQCSYNLVQYFISISLCNSVR